jgi:hypothetical protein
MIKHFTKIKYKCLFDTPFDVERLSGSSNLIEVVH